MPFGKRFRGRQRAVWAALFPIRLDSPPAGGLTLRSAKMTLVFLGGATVASVFTATPSFESLLSMLSPAAAAASALFSSSADVDGRFSSSSSPLPGQKKSCRKSVVVGRERMPLFASRLPRSSLRGRGAPRVAPLLLRRRGVRLGLLRVRLSPLLLAPRGSRSGRIHRQATRRARATPPPRDLALRPFGSALALCVPALSASLLSVRRV